MRVLVTGGAGFIGSHLVEALIAAGHEPFIFDNLSTGSRANIPRGVWLVEGDVRDTNALAEAFDPSIDAVMHLAGQASIRLSYADPAADLSVNTLGTINLLNECIRRQVTRFLFASSMTLYGNSAVTPTPEDAPPNPISNYAVTKYAAERYVHIAAERRDLPAPLHVTSLRMFNVYGERQSLTNAYQGVFAIFIGNVLRGEPITIHSDGEQTRDFVHISDVTRAWVNALTLPSAYGQVINIGTGVGCSVNSLCDLVLAQFGHTRATHPVRYAPAQLGDMRASAADIRRAQALLGWQPRIPFADGMARTIAWARGVVSAFS